MSFEMKEVLLDSFTDTSANGLRFPGTGNLPVIPPGCPSSYIKVGLENEGLGPII